MSCCLTSDALSFPLNLQYNSLPIEKTARVPYSPQLMYLILPFFTLLFYKVIMLARSQLLEELIFKLFPSKETITSLSIGKNSVYLPE